MVNFVTAAGGRDAETLDAAEIRARKELSTRSRAVTAGGFRLDRQPDADGRGGPGAGRAAAPAARRQHGGQTGDDHAMRAAVPTAPPAWPTPIAAGVVSVIVVPQQTGPEPTPTPSFLKAVCQYLDPHRLVTTEVYVVPPQYARLCNMQVSVKGQPGYTRAQLQTLVSARLATYLHVLTGGDDGTGFASATNCTSPT